MFHPARALVGLRFGPNEIRHASSGGYMRKALAILSWTAVGFVVSAVPTQAQTRSVSGSVSRLVLAQCPGPMACDSSGITFTRGDVSFQIRNPAPVFSS